LLTNLVWWKGNPVVSKRLRVVSDAVVEELGSDLMVMLPGSSDVLFLSGESAGVVRQVQGGKSVEVNGTVSDLIARGVLESAKLSRRGLITAGAIGAGAGIAVMAMPGVAAAASVALGTYEIYYTAPDGSGLYSLWIPVAGADFSPSVELEFGGGYDGPGTGSTISLTPTNNGKDTFGTYWVFDQDTGGFPADPTGPWTVVDNGVTLSGPIFAIPFNL
jgi:hypothetical protein